MNKADITENSIFRAKNPEGTNYQIWPDSKWKQVFNYAEISGVRTHYEGGKNVTYIYYFPFNGHSQRGFLSSRGLCSCSKLSTFKKEFKPLIFNK